MINQHAQEVLDEIYSQLVAFLTCRNLMAGDGEKLLTMINNGNPASTVQWFFFETILPRAESEEDAAELCRLVGFFYPGVDYPLK